MVESKFRAKLSKTLKDAGCFVQTIENTVGRGVPDLVAMIRGGTLWLELKAGVTKTCYIRKEQYVWHLKAKKQDIPLLTIQFVGDELKIYGLKNAVPVKDKVRLTEVLWSGTYRAFSEDPLDAIAASITAAY